MHIYLISHIISFPLCQLHPDLPPPSRDSFILSLSVCLVSVSLFSFFLIWGIVLLHIKWNFNFPSTYCI